MEAMSDTNDAGASFREPIEYSRANVAPSPTYSGRAEGTPGRMEVEWPRAAFMQLPRVNVPRGGRRWQPCRHNAQMDGSVAVGGLGESLVGLWGCNVNAR